MLLSSTGNSVAPPGSGQSHAISSMQGQRWAAAALAPPPLSALSAASISHQSAAMAWLTATVAPASSGGRPQLPPPARTAATQTMVGLGTTAQLQLQPQQQPQPGPHRPDEDQSLASTAAVATSPSPSSSPSCPEEDAQSPPQHPVLLMAQVQKGSALALDAVRLEGQQEEKACIANRQKEPPPARRSDTFIGHHVSPVQDEEAWAQASVILNESPLVTTRPTTHQLLDAHLLSAKPLPRAQHWGLGRREQDRALAELKQALGPPPPKRQGNYHRGPRPHKEKAAEEQATGAVADVVGMAGSQQEGQEQNGASSGSSTAREQDDDGGSSVVSADLSSRGGGDGGGGGGGGDGDGGCGGGGGGGGGQRRGLKRGREQDGGHSSTGTFTSGSSGVNAKAAAVKKGPKIEVLEDDTILVDGVAVCAPTDKWYAPLFGLASMEKHKDPEWHIANGIVDRCYYRGFKKKAKTRPGIDYFPTDQAMMADFVKRKPEVFITQVLNG